MPFSAKGGERVDVKHSALLTELRQLCLWLPIGLPGPTGAEHCWNPFGDRLLPVMAGSPKTGWPPPPPPGWMPRPGGTQPGRAGESPSFCGIWCSSSPGSCWEKSMLNSSAQILSAGQTLDSCERLRIQVHPTAEQAQSLFGTAHGKG